ncbi:MAG: heparinase II/III family protein [Candidatus Puniceispirillaceae bacterium]
MPAKTDIIESGLAPMAHPQRMRLTAIDRVIRGTGLFGWQLRGKPRGLLRASLQDPWRGDLTNGRDILSHRLDPLDDAAYFQSFEWIRDLRVEGGSDARARARDLIAGWLDNNQSWQLPDWRPDIMGRRLAVLALNYGWYGHSAPEQFQDKLSAALDMQLNCLATDWRRMRSAEDQISALRGLALAEIAFGISPEKFAALLDLMMPKLDSVILADGGHVSRMPDRNVTLMRQLVELRIAASAAGVDSTRLGDMITRMGALIRMWRHGDGRLAHFNGGGGINAAHVEETLLRAGVRGKPLQQAPYSGFLRIGSGRTVVIMDAGEPVAVRDGQDVTGLGTLGFEMSVGQTQLIVNPGQMMTDPTMRRIMASTAAHSTLGLDNQNSSSPRKGRMASISGVEVGEADGGILAVATHDGFDASHGLLHHRKLYLKTGGANLRGADILEYTGAPGEIPQLALIRFHLHPRVTAAMLANGSVLMKIRGSKTGWTMKASGAVAEIDNSVYFDDGVRQACQQIILKAVITDIRTIGTHEVRWAFTRGG